MTLHAIHDPTGKSRGPLCFIRDARDAAHALKITRAQGLTLGRGSIARKITLDEYADHLRAAGFKVGGTTPNLPNFP